MIVVTDKIVLSPKWEWAVVSLDKKTFVLTDKNQTMNFTCHKKWR